MKRTVAETPAADPGDIEDTVDTPEMCDTAVHCRAGVTFHGQVAREPATA